VFFTTGGSTAIDTALQFVAYRNNFLGRPQKKLVLARENAYHGSSYLSHSVSATYDYMDQARDMVALLLCPDPNDAPDGATLQEWEDLLVENLEAVISEKGAENIGSMIAEPIMGAGGVIVPPPGYLQRCQRVCTANDIVFIADEVVTAFGRLGHYFASEAVFGIEPDIICFAKGVTSGYQPLGGLLISDRMLAALDTEGSKFTTGFTYSGHPVACSAALANLQIYEDDKLLEHVQRTAPYFQSKLRQELEPLPLVSTSGLRLVAGYRRAHPAGLPRDLDLLLILVHRCVS
jgi:adenosylmethionine-8-amino-7-oxononanoate aminotransferase